MSHDYYRQLPLLLRDEFVAGRWLPVVGAGLSANASTRGGERPPTWTDLGSAISKYLGNGFGSDGPVDALSSFEQFHGRPALVDKLRDLLLVDQVEPSDVHVAFAKIPFETVLTTNIDFLLEKAWTGERWPFDPLVGEHRLTARQRRERTQLVKLHGDVHHPNELVVTEADYEGFLPRFPILATFVASLLITRVPVLIGYSLDDPDFRSILRVLSDRLGKNGPAPWVILAKATRAQVARYERRGVRVVVLENRQNVDHGRVLKSLFDQLSAEYSKAAVASMESSQDQVLSELRLEGAPGRTLVLFLASNKHLAQHRSDVFDALRLQGLIPATVDEIQPYPGLLLASLKQFVQRASVVVIDLRGQSRSTLAELDVVLQQRQAMPIVIVGEKQQPPPLDLAECPILAAPDDGPLPSGLVQSLVDIIIEITGGRDSSRIDTIEARLALGDVQFAFLEAVTAVESELRSYDGLSKARWPELLRKHPDIEPAEEAMLREAYGIRSRLLHESTHPPDELARQLTLQMVEILQRIENHP